MSDSDYKAGRMGIEYQGSMDRVDHAKGMAIHDVIQNMVGKGGSSGGGVDGPGLVGIIVSPVLALMYPVAGSLMVLSLVAAAGIGSLLPVSWGPLKVVLLIGFPLGMLYYALKAEHRASASRPYRGFRSAFRLLLAGALVVFILMRAGRHTANQAAINGGGQMVAMIAAILFVAWLFPRFDRQFFPVRDDYAIAQEKKYTGLSEEQVFTVKNRKFHGILKFGSVWLVGTIGLMMLLRHVPVVITASGMFAACWMVRKKLFFDRAAVVAEVKGPVQ